MTGPQEDYGTLVRGSLLRGEDEHGQYTTAAFEQDNLYMDIILRPNGYGLEFGSDKGLRGIYQSIREHYHPQGLVQAVDVEGNSFRLDPDAWRGGDYEDFVEAYIKFDGFGVEWSDLEEDAEKESLLNVFSNTLHFDTEEAVFEPARPITNSVTDIDSEASREVFNDIRFFLNEG